jgi:hypothetical protein
MFKIRDIVRLLHLLEVAVSQHVRPRKHDISNYLVECERLLAEEEDTRPKAEIIKQANGEAAYTSNPML